MIARELISHLIQPLHTSDSGEQALTYLQVYHLKHLPIVNNEQLLGTISEEDIESLSRLLYRTHFSGSDERTPRVRNAT